MSHTLAILGGTPAFAGSLHVGRPNIGDQAKFLERTNDIFARRWFTNSGYYVREFEDRLKAHTGVKHCIPICNATVGLELAIRALDLKGEVIVPAYTFVATAHALQWQELTPVFCDVDPVTHNLDPDKIERMLTPRTTGIIGVHLWGRACAPEALTELAKRRGLRLMYDAAHAFGCSHGGTMIGNFGECEVFSFHATKFMNTFEGGAIATNNDSLAEKIRLMKNFGFAGYDRVIYTGTNGKMNELSAAMGITNLESIDVFIDANRERLGIYQCELASVPGLDVIRYADADKNNFQYVVLEVDAASFGLSRDEIVEALHAENLLSRRYFAPGCHRHEPYRSLYPNAGMLLPETERLCEIVMTLPTGTGIATDDVYRACEIIRSIQQNAPSVRAALAARKK
jgi:dTDP-4-amino-4,6-dideoxygalactose transaminase